MVRSGATPETSSDGEAETRIQRWVGAALLDAERRFRRLHGYRDIPWLLNALEDPSHRFNQPDKAA